MRKILLSLHNWLKSRPKVIHWCWWFEKHGLPVPPYFVGGGATSNLDHWIWMANDNADPDDGTTGTEDVGYTDMAKETNFALRFSISETGGGTVNNATWELYGNTSDTIGTATQIDTGTTTTWAQITDGTPDTSGGDIVTDTNVMTAHGSETWQDGWYTEGDATSKLSLSGTTEIMFSLSFTASAGNSQKYYFWIKYSTGQDLHNQHATTCNVTTEAGAAVTRRRMIMGLHKAILLVPFAAMVVNKPVSRRKFLLGRWFMFLIGGAK